MIDEEWQLDEDMATYLLSGKEQEGVIQMFSSRQLIIPNLIQDHSPKVSEQEIPCSVK